MASTEHLETGQVAAEDDANALRRLRTATAKA